MERHRENLRKQVERGVLVCAGRVEGEEAGVLIYKSDNIDNLKNLLEEEPYSQNGYIDKVEISILNPTIGNI